MIRALVSRLDRLGRRLAVLPLPTRTGWYFVAASTSLFIAGAYYGENAFVLLSCLPMALVIVNLAAVWLSTRGLAVHREMPSHTHAGESIEIGLVVASRKRVASLGLELDDERPPNLFRDEPVILLQYAQAGAAQRIGYTAVLGRRGRHALARLLLSSAWPFGLARMTRVHHCRSEIVVYPRPFRLSRAFEERLLSNARFFGESAASNRGQEEVFGVREYLPGHNVARIHWPTTARSGKPMVLELEGRQDASFVLILDVFPVGDPGALRQRLENAVGLVAGLAYYLTRQGVLFRLACHGSAPEISPSGRGDSHYHAIMEKLAFTGFSECPLSEWIDSAELGMGREVPVLVTLGPKEHAEARLQSMPGAFVVSVSDSDLRRYLTIDPLGRRSVSPGELLRRPEESDAAESPEPEAAP